MSARRNQLLAAVAALTLTPVAALAVTTPGEAMPAPAAAALATEPAAKLWAPVKVVGYLYGSRERTRVPIDARLIAGAAPLELWSNRTSYAEPITTVWRTPDGDVALPPGSMSTFNALDDFVNISVKNLTTGKQLKTRHQDVCLNSRGDRVRPDAPARSPYPKYCFANPYSLGSVQGIQAGWSTSLLGGDEGRGGGVRLEKGIYDVKVTIAPAYARILKIPAADATRTVRVRVKRDDGGHDHGGGVPIEPSHRLAQPAANPPTGPELLAVEGPRPNLRSLPAWGITMAENGNFLRFAATVWNAGDSPLVVDGFRVEAQDLMDAYQYFFDGDGNQTGYQKIGSFEYDDKASHQHWHFRDFARYTLLRADKTTAAVSKKESFCLANTDSIDQTVPNADWNPENTDLSTDCGEPGSMSLREVLSAGWGDTYAQFRAGQSFNLKGLPNGTYYIATIANPRNRLVESSTADNTSLRKIYVSGTDGNRKVRVPKIGLIEEPTEQW
ncbi:MAG: lysyl oxidase family protein [Actinomycetota bacterium]|nr:lysyl oxidase family protein [Actinomycetota bacterium]